MSKPSMTTVGSILTLGSRCFRVPRDTARNSSRRGQRSRGQRSRGTAPAPAREPVWAHTDALRVRRNAHAGHGVCCCEVSPRSSCGGRLAGCECISPESVSNETYFLTYTLEVAAKTGAGLQYLTCIPTPIGVYIVPPRSHKHTPILYIPQLRPRPARAGCILRGFHKTR